MELSERVIFGHTGNFCGGKNLPLFAATGLAESEEKEKLNQAQRMPYVADDFRCALQICALVRCRYDRAQPGLAFGNCGESDSGNVDAGVVEAA